MTHVATMLSINAARLRLPGDWGPSRSIVAGCSTVSAGGRGHHTQQGPSTLPLSSSGSRLGLPWGPGQWQGTPQCCGCCLERACCSCGIRSLPPLGCRPASEQPGIGALADVEAASGAQLEREEAGQGTAALQHPSDSHGDEPGGLESTVHCELLESLVVEGSSWSARTTPQHPRRRRPP